MEEKEQFVTTDRAAKLRRGSQNLEMNSQEAKTIDKTIEVSASKKEKP